MVTKPEKFSSNEDRVKYLEALFADKDTQNPRRAVQLAWEWTKTGKFDLATYESVLRAYGRAVLGLGSQTL